MVHESSFTAIQIYLLVAHGITFVLGILGNGLVIWVTGFRMARTVTTTYYLNLALADFTFSALLPINMVSIVMGGQWVLGSFLCKLSFTMMDTNLYASVFLIAFIALDRCICVLWPVWVQNHRTVSLARKVVIVPWIFTLVFSLPILIFVTTIKDEVGNTYCGFNFEFWSNSTEIRWDMVFTTITTMGIIHFVIGFTIPMLIILISYGIITAKICKKGMMKSNRSLWVLTAVIASFFLCWFPFQLTFLLARVWLSDEKHHEKYNILLILISLTGSLAFFNSCLNPILYVFMGRDFRKSLIHSLPASLERALTENSALLSVTTAKSASPSTEAELQEM